MQTTATPAQTHTNLVVLALSGGAGLLTATSLELSSGGAILTGFGAALLVMLIAGWVSHLKFS